ncbi:Putative CutA-like periplasmic cation tolerance protein [Candidatus Fokinia solitaria]|uniref:CutA-like periplasmic cation tolerance protein n=1 Tax=Candidatus Fokinia solitaria TaxID=1802984 RepID=A0A2U8BT28_9RICK|nr:divalent-cation tolerance protein CutA [Candidatus Fokinia solitaria]AWD33468.1 Putative CutA-like periplasmic cation tolerance protein [Candidatus Fokinia solitaria]
MISIIYTTFQTTHDAKEIAMKILHEKLAFCVNLIPGAQSFYLSEGKMQNIEEVVLLIKTVEKCEDNLMKFISVHHPYDIPFIAKIASIPKDKCNDLYVNWLQTSEQHNFS